MAKSFLLVFHFSDGNDFYWCFSVTIHFLFFCCFNMNCSVCDDNIGSICFKCCKGSFFCASCISSWKASCLSDGKRLSCPTCRAVNPKVLSEGKKRKREEETFAADLDAALKSSRLAGEEEVTFLTSRVVKQVEEEEEEYLTALSLSLCAEEDDDLLAAMAEFKRLESIAADEAFARSIELLP